MGELLEIGAYVLAIGIIGWGLYRVFGAQAFGLPAMVGVLVIAAALSIFSSVVVLLAMAVGLVVLALVIGMTMTLGPEPPTPDARPMDDFRP